MSDLLLDDQSGLESLVGLVRESAASGVKRRVLVVRTDTLPPTLSRPAHLRRAREALDPLLLMADRGRYHELPGRLAVSWRGDAPKLLQQVVDALDALLEEDRFDAPGINQLMAVFNLPEDGSELLREAAARPAVPARTASLPQEPVFDLPVTLRPLEPLALERIEHSLALADLSSFARRHSVCHLSAHGMALAWEERTLSVGDLIGDVAPGFDAEADPWLFRRLTRILDRRLLSLLADAPELRDALPFSLALNVSSVLSADFLRFDAVLPSTLRNRVVLTFLPDELAADASAFAFARNFARARDYRIGLRAVTAAMLPVFALPALELDFVELAWTPAMADLPALPPTGGARWIVGRPCNTEAIAWGTAAGIGLYGVRPTT